jgi:DNA-binding transcriptional regulator YdaS (Cro superfamily)
MRKPPMQRAVDEAVRRVGSLKRLAERLDITRQAIQHWTSVPVKHVLTLEALSGVTRYELRPDIYGSDPEGQSRSNGRQVRAA